jgi:iron complex outermembrane receptor protein
MKTTKTSYFASTALFTLGLLAAAPAYAQDAQPDGEEADASEIIVTGSRIRGIAPVGSAVIAVDQAKIEREPVLSVNDILRRVPQVVSLGANRAGGSAQNGAANATRGAGINLRGLSTNATLLLYDGRRLPPQGTQGQFTDPSVIPSIALGRLEVVADGASAIYGSDAVAGVVNMILRKDFDGIEARARYGFADGNYSEAQAAALFGKTWSGGYLTLAGEYTKNSTLLGKDLDFYQDDNRYRGGRDLRVSTCNPGQISVGGSTYAIPAGGVTAANVGSLVKGSTNKCFYNGEDSVIPNQERYSFVGAASHELTDSIRLFADGFYSKRTGTVRTQGTFTATVRPANPFFVSPVAAASVSVPYSLFPELGMFESPYHASSWNAVGGIEVKPFGDFRATLYYAHGQADEVVERSRGVNTAALNAALADTNPLTALNVFGGANNPATLAKISDNLFIITGKTKLDVINGQIDGSLFDMPGGRVRVALGAEHRKEYTFTDLITGQAATPLSVNDAGTRNVDALFGELFIPLVGAENRSTGFEKLNLSMAIRHENYSDFGSTTNPKFGLTWEPFPGLTLKSTYGTSFRAPTFTEVSTIAGGAGLYFDTLPDFSGNSIGIGIAGGNPNLKPETAKTWSFGVEAAPPSIPGLFLTVNHFRINYSNQIQALRGTAGILTNPLYASFVTRNPSAAAIAALVGSGLPVNNAINQSQVTFFVDGRRQNLGKSLMNGLDGVLSYNWDWGSAKMDAGVQGTYILKYMFESVPGAGLTNVLNTFGFSNKFRMQADIGVEYNSFRARATLNHLGGYDNGTVNPVQHVKSYETVDLMLGYTFDERFTLSVDARNLFNQDPPFVDTTRGYDPQASNPVPRMISFTASVKF